MESESWLGRLKGAIGRAILGSDNGQGETSYGNPDLELDFTKQEQRMLDRASRTGIIGGNYRREGEMITMVFEMRARRLARAKEQQLPDKQ